jgi:hypothetical protein
MRCGNHKISPKNALLNAPLLRMAITWAVRWTLNGAVWADPTLLNAGNHRNGKLHCKPGFSWLNSRNNPDSIRSWVCELRNRWWCHTSNARIRAILIRMIKPRGWVSETSTRWKSNVTSKKSNCCNVKRSISSGRSNVKWSNYGRLRTNRN